MYNVPACDGDRAGSVGASCEIWGVPGFPQTEDWPQETKTHTPSTCQAEGDAFLTGREGGV